MMSFFRTTDGRVHFLRIGTVLYSLAVLPGCGFSLDPDALCFTRLVSAVGWWIAFTAKGFPASGRDAVFSPRSILGVTLVLAGLVGNSYFLATR
jgi:hypothetical protein